MKQDTLHKITASYFRRLDCQEQTRAVVREAVKDYERGSVQAAKFFAANPYTVIAPDLVKTCLERNDDKSPAYMLLRLEFAVGVEMEEGFLDDGGDYVYHGLIVPAYDGTVKWGEWEGVNGLGDEEKITLLPHLLGDWIKNPLRFTNTKERVLFNESTHMPLREFSDKLKKWMQNLT